MGKYLHRASLFIVLALIVIHPVSAKGKTYKWVDDQGVAHFTDNPASIPPKFRDAASPEENPPPQTPPQTPPPAGLAHEERRARAVAEIRQGAERGNAELQYNLAILYLNGLHVPRDESQAAVWFRKAAEQGYGLAQQTLGGMYRSGQGVKQDYAEALKWYLKAAEQGGAIALTALGEMYQTGQGVKQDYAEAAKWYKKALGPVEGNVKAHYGIGILYARGQGVPKDTVEAYKWLKTAVFKGMTSANGDLDKLRKEMTAAQIAEGERLYKEWVDQEFLQKR